MIGCGVMGKQSDFIALTNLLLVYYNSRGFMSQLYHNFSLIGIETS
jgi:hypothetical protein